MATIREKIGLDALYPKSATVLLWMGSAIAIIIGASWVLVHTHEHPSYVQQRELEQIFDTQKEIKAAVSHLTDTIFDQTMIINELKGRVEWLKPQER